MKPGKPPSEVSSYKPIFLLLVILKLLEVIGEMDETKELIPEHQFEFREDHSTIENIHGIMTII